MRTGLNHLLWVIFFMLCVPLVLCAEIYYVDEAGGDDTNDGTSWQDAVRTIQAAIDTSADGDEIRVRQGEYLLSSTIIVDRSIAIYGGFPAGLATPGWTDRDVSGNTTMVNAGGGLGCFLVGGTNSVSVTIDGFTITGGNAAEGYGGAIYNNLNSEIHISRCIFTDNTAEIAGGAIFNETGSRCLIVNSLFTGNAASGAQANGGAVFNNAADNVEIMNCTFFANSAASGDGGAIYNDQDSWPGCTITNSILWGNSAAAYPDIANQGLTGPLDTTMFCTIGQPGYDGEHNNISADPLFIDITGTTPQDRDLHLSAASPSIDTGTALGVPNTDLDGTPRPSGYGYDMGAYEYQPPPNTDIAVDPSSIDFDDVLVGQSASQTVTLSNNWDELDIFVSTISVDDAANFSVNSSGGFILGPGANTTISVSFHPGSAADFQSVLTIVSDDPDDPVVGVNLSGTGIELTNYDLTINVNGQGSVTLNPDDESYPEGTSVEVTAVPAAGWEFDRWSGDLRGSDNPETIVMNDDISITANFIEMQAPEYDLTIHTDGQGSVSASPPDSPYEEGTVVTLNASPDPGYQLISWSGTDNDASTALSNTVTMDSNKTVSATFALIPPEQFTLSVTTTGSGRVDLYPSGGTYEEGTRVTVVASPDTGWQFAGWSGAITGTDNPQSIVMNADKAVTAIFTEVPPDQYALTVRTVGSGSIVLDPDGGIYDEGTVVRLTASPDTGYQLSSWSGTDNDASTALTNTVTMDRDKTAQVTFEAIPEFDSDMDGIPDDEEKGSNGTDDNYDGNLDGIPDAQQANVASYHTYDGTYYLTIASPEGTAIADAHNDEPPESAPQDYSFPFGLISFALSDITAGGPTTVKLYLPAGLSCDTYYKYNSTASTWEEFLYDGLTGAQIAANIITLHLVDGLRGDQDRVPDGIIIDPGTPAISNATHSAQSSDPDNVCFVKTADTGSRSIHSLLILLLILSTGFMPILRSARK